MAGTGASQVLNKLIDDVKSSIHKGTLRVGHGRAGDGRKGWRKVEEGKEKTSFLFIMAFHSRTE